ncbi:heterogeneous nuclear ribonucleoprotein Q isoform X2 [Magnolia sinica]|uniref:heterogeneous nuclear ribonucleoprotein Q isoform X2 n=1 Tax=Magnolia sinica TaxID=86752 RepID=UPI002657EB24|nr:heterogeneous nuclear ribonucleoprotein Q isoform X2 [Magnolia sinica]
MPPRTVKKAAGAAGPKKNPARTAKSTPKKKSAPQVPEEPTKTEEVSVFVEEVKEEIKVEEAKVEEVVEEEPPVEKPSVPEPEVKAEANGLLAAKEEDVKGAFDEDDKGERLDLEDNEPEYEPEEDPGVEYEEVEHEDGQDDGDDIEVEGEQGDAGEEDEGNMAEEEFEDGGEGEEDGENDEEEHEDIVEEEEHHEVAKERRKRKEYEVFVGGLDKDATEADLNKVFSVVGEITEVRLMMNPQTKKNKGFAFLRFATVEQAKRAVSELKSPMVNGKQCGVAPSQDNDTLFLGNICKTWTKEALKEKLKHYGIENVEDLNLVEDTINEGMNRGFAFLEFPSRSDAMDAYKRLQKRDIVFGVDRTAKVAFADSFIEPDDEIMSQVKTVFVDGLPASWDEDRVKEHLKKFGVIEKIELARNMPSAKRKDFGFVTFDSHDMAVACAEGINNAELGEGDHKVKVRARLSRPHRIGRLKRGVRGGDFRIGRGAMQGGRGSWGRGVAVRRFPGRGSREFEGRGATMAGRGFKRPFGLRDRRVVMAAPERVRHFPPPSRSYDRRPPIPRYPKSSSKREYGRYEELPTRSRPAVDYGSRVAAERRPSYRDDYTPRGSSYSDVAPRSAPRTASRRSYVDEDYDPRFERLPASYREGRGRDYDSISGSKRPYSALDDVPPRYADTSVRQSRARLDYGMSGSASIYGDAYAERLGRSHLGYGSGRSSLSSQEPHSLYGSRHGMGYGGSVSSSDVGMYSTSYSSDYLSRGPDVGSSSYSSLYSGRSLSGGGGYLGSGGSGSYY